MVSAREAAFRSLVKCEQKGSYTNLEVDAKIKKFGLEGSEKALYTVLVYGVTERKLSLDYYLSELCDRPWDDLDAVVKTILEIGAYQIIYLDRIPESAAVNEAVEMAKRHAPFGANNFINAVLRKLCLGVPDLPDDEELKRVVKYSIPGEIIDIWNSSYGKEESELILNNVNLIPDVTLRVNTLKNSADDFKKLLEKNNARYKDAEIENAIILRTPVSDIMDLIESGCCYVQDTSSQMAVQALNPKPGTLLIDTCSCPGGKSFLSAILMKNSGEIKSFDIHENKLSLIKRGAAKLGIDIIDIEKVDAKNPKEELFEKADYVICDVPCSGLGVISKKPEIRYKARDEINQLPDLQAKILSESSKYVKSGGSLLYSTCTLNVDENDNIVEEFVSYNANYEILKKETIFPSRTNDGFFYCVMKRK